MSVAGTQPTPDVATPHSERLCIYCQVNPADTDDHVPPQGMFDRPLPSDLFTVPACRGCNGGFQKDDEYFRDCVAIDRRSGNHPDAIAVIRRVLRGLQRPSGRRYARYFLGRVGAIELRTVLGLYLGRSGAYNVDLKRLGRVVSRIVCGLYYKEHGVPLPLTSGAEAFFSEGFAHLATWDMERIRDTVIRPALAGPMRSVGRGVLRYWTAHASADPTVSAWVLQFYGGLRCIGITLPREELER